MAEVTLFVCDCGWSLNKASGMTHCEDCEQPIRGVPHVPASEATRLREGLDWLLSDDTGLSSEAILCHMLGIERSGWKAQYAPRDKADRARCVRLLRLFPEWEPRLDEMAEVHPDWVEQIPLIRAELTHGVTA